MRVHYMRHLHRYNCKPNTLRASLSACQLFLSFAEHLGKTYLEQSTRSDLEAFVEHEQDRGLAMVSVRTKQKKTVLAEWCMSALMPFVL